jgi:hypothetical protein
MNPLETRLGRAFDNQRLREASEHEATKDIETILDEREHEFADKEIEEEMED